MEEHNNGELSREYRGQEQKEGGKDQESKQKGNKVQQQGGKEPPFLFGVGPDNTIPAIEDQLNKKENHIQQQGGQEPTLFGQSQFKDGFGPVYAIPSVPWKDGASIIDGEPNKRENHVQQRGGQGPPILFDQVQFKGGFGQVNAVPTGPRQQWGGHPQTMMPCCNCCQIGYRYYR